jgi:hypothetical protein
MFNMMKIGWWFWNGAILQEKDRGVPAVAMPQP